MDLGVKQFLDSVTNTNTNKEYRYGIKKFCEWIDKSPREVLEMRKDDLTQRFGENIIEYRNRASRFEKELEKFHSHLINKGYKINTARTSTIGIRQLFRFYQMPVKMRAGSRVTKTVKTTRNYPLRIEHVRKMFTIADLRERVLLSMATDLGLRTSDFIKIKKDSLPSLKQEPPIPFDIMTNKEEIIANGFLSDETVELLKVYLPTLNKKDNPYLFPSNGKRPISDEWLNRLLKKLASKAQIDMNGKSLTFHCFRKMFLSASIDSGIGLTAGKMLCGKAIPQSDNTYLTTVQLRTKFTQLKKFLTIKETYTLKKQEKIEALEKVVTNLQTNLTQQELITKTVTKENININKRLKKTNEEIDKLDDKIKELEKTKEDWARDTLDKLLKMFFTEELDHFIDNHLKKRGLI